ncbi:MAG: hypothetical protein D6719_02015 [Candidatus Dadabacteria bacterium]|nr:MAG: hypothetical protein D6719_02015 [Candidatus Dadabacteria bacterium]
MELVKSTDSYKIYQKRSKRYAVQDQNGNWINGDQKVEILVQEKLISAALPKPKKDEAKEAEQADQPEEN